MAVTACKKGSTLTSGGQVVSLAGSGNVCQHPTDGCGFVLVIVLAITIYTICPKFHSRLPSSIYFTMTIPMILGMCHKSCREAIMKFCHFHTKNGIS